MHTLRLDKIKPDFLFVAIISIPTKKFTCIIQYDIAFFKVCYYILKKTMK